MDERLDPNTPDQDEGIAAYHGSPHDFDRFDLNKIGTGEGAQAYGHGLYFAESEPVARGYRDKLSDKQSLVDAAMKRFGGVDGAIDAMKKTIQEYQSGYYTDPFGLESAQKTLGQLERQKAGLLNTGHMYEVRIAAHPDHFLDWDKPLVEQPHIMQAIDRHIGDPEIVVDQLFGHREATGRDLHERFGGEHKPAAVAQRLSEMGIKGIKYLDASSRDGTDAPTRNYVVFDDKHVSVRRKYEQGGAVERRAAGGSAVATMRRMSDPAVNEAIRVINRSGSSPRDAVTLSKRLLGRQ